MLKILADEYIHKYLFMAVKKRGFDILSVKEAGLTGAGDEEIFDFAVKTRRILLTYDRGFGDIFRFNISRSAGVIVFLIEQMAKDEAIDIALKFFSYLKKSKFYGKLAIVGKDKVRIIER